MLPSRNQKQWLHALFHLCSGSSEGSVSGGSNLSDLSYSIETRRGSSFASLPSLLLVTPCGSNFLSLHMSNDGRQNHNKNTCCRRLIGPRIRIATTICILCTYTSLTLAAQNLNGHKTHGFSKPARRNRVHGEEIESVVVRLKKTLKASTVGLRGAERARRN